MPVGQVAGEIPGATLLNLSRKGMAIVVPESSFLSRGGVYRVMLLDPVHSVEVEGQVCWVRTDAEQRSESGEGAQAIQIAGLSFRRILTREPQGTWRQLLADPVVPDERTVGSSGEVTDESKPPRVIEMITPLDGVDVVDASILVTCKLSEPEEVSSLSVNGVEATLEGGQAMATLSLEPGLNSLRALIWRQDGSYRSYFLGRVNHHVRS